MNDLPRRTGPQETTLLELSLQHYRTQIRQRMMRYKQLIVVGTLLLLPSIIAFKTLVLDPLAGIFHARGTPGAGMAAAVFVTATALWARLQRDAVAYPSAAAFTASLPLSRGTLLRRDLAVFALASSPFLILLLAAFLSTQLSRTPVLDAVALLGILLASFTCQLAVARGALSWSVVAVVAGGVIGGARWTAAPALMAALSAYVLWRLPRSQPWREGDYLQSRAEASPRGARAIGWVRLYWRSLHQAAHGAYRFSIVASMALTALVAVALHTGADAPLRNCGLLLVHAALVTGFFGMGFATLFKNQAIYGALLKSLPVGRIRRVVNTIVAVEFPAALLVLLLAASSLTLASGPRIAAVVFGVTVMLCGIQYLIYRYSPDHTIVASLVVGIVAIAMTLHLAPRLGIQP